jgi:hypothetical protein
MNTDKKQKAETAFSALLSGFLRRFLPGHILVLFLIRVHPRKSAANFGVRRLVAAFVNV